MSINMQGSSPWDKSEFFSHKSEFIAPRTKIEVEKGKTTGGLGVKILSAIGGGALKNIIRDSIYGEKEERKDVNYMLRGELLRMPCGIAKEHKIKSDDNISLEVMVIQASEPAHDGKPKTPLNNQETVIICTGSIKSYEKYALEIARAYLERGVNVVLYNGRGFGHSEGKPSQVGSYRDVEAVYQFTKQIPELRGDQDEYPDSKLIVHGYSLGGGAAFHLASMHPSINLIGDRIWARASDVAEYRLKSDGRSNTLVAVTKEIVEKNFSYANEEKIKNVTGEILLFQETGETEMPTDAADKIAQSYGQTEKEQERQGLRATYKDISHFHRALPNSASADYFWGDRRSDHHFSFDKYLDTIFPNRKTPSVLPDENNPMGGIAPQQKTQPTKEEPVKAEEPAASKAVSFRTEGTERSERSERSGRSGRLQLSQFSLRQTYRDVQVFEKKDELR